MDEKIGREGKREHRVKRWVSARVRFARCSGSVLLLKGGFFPIIIWRQLFSLSFHRTVSVGLTRTWRIQEIEQRTLWRLKRTGTRRLKMKMIKQRICVRKRETGIGEGIKMVKNKVMRHPNHFKVGQKRRRIGNALAFQLPYLVKEEATVHRRLYSNGVT